MTSDATLALQWRHINVNVSDLDRSITFYETLGFEVYRPAIPFLKLEMTGTRNKMAAGAMRALGVPPSFRSRGCHTQLGRGFPKLDLIEVANGAPRTPLLNADHGVVRICLSTNDLDAVYADLSAKDVEFLTSPETTQDAMVKVAVCRDSDGMLI